MDESGIIRVICRDRRIRRSTLIGVAANPATGARSHHSRHLGNLVVPQHRVRHIAQDIVGRNILEAANPPPIIEELLTLLPKRFMQRSFVGLYGLEVLLCGLAELILPLVQQSMIMLYLVTTTAQSRPTTHLPCDKTSGAATPNTYDNPETTRPHKRLLHHVAVLDTALSARRSPATSSVILCVGFPPLPPAPHLKITISRGRLVNGRR